MVIITRYEDFEEKARDTGAIAPSSNNNTELEIQLDDDRINASDLARVITRFGGQLETLKISCGGFKDNIWRSRFREALFGCQQLKEFHFFPGSPKDNYYMLHFGGALPYMNTLEVVAVHSEHYKFLIPLLYIRLRKLTIGPCFRDTFKGLGYGYDEKIQQFFDACKTSTVLQELTIVPPDFFSPHKNLAHEELRGLCQLLEHSTSLRCLEVHLRGEEMLELAKGLKNNHSLKKIKISCHDLKGPLKPNGMSKKLMAALYSSLQGNKILEEMEISISSKFRSWKWADDCRWRWSYSSRYNAHLAGIDILLCLNRVGGSSHDKPLEPSVFGSRTTSEWIDAIGNELNGNLSAAYCFLRNNPSLCEKAIPTKKGQRIINRAISRNRGIKRKHQATLEQNE